jgi:hypothetical protein
MASSSPADDANQDSIIKKTLDWIVDAGINGMGILPPASKVAEDHRRHTADVESAIDSVILWRTTYAAGTGFVSGVGGLAAMPIAIPAALCTSYALAANTAAAVACLRGYDVHSEQTRTMILLCLVGESFEEFLKVAGIAVGIKLSRKLLEQIPGRVLIEINKRVGFRLMTKAGEKGVVNLMKIVPFVGGVIGAGFDSTFVNAAGRVSKRLFT